MVGDEPENLGLRYEGSVTLEYAVGAGLSPGTYRGEKGRSLRIGTRQGSVMVQEWGPCLLRF
jgi:hypothetical protein